MNGDFFLALRCNRLFSQYHITISLIMQASSEYHYCTRRGIDLTGWRLLNIEVYMGFTLPCGESILPDYM